MCVFSGKKSNLFFPILHKSSAHGRFHEQKTEIKGIIVIRNFWTTGVVSCNNESKQISGIDAIKYYT